MSGKRVVVTGGAGFLGALIADRLRQQEWCGAVLTPRSHEQGLREKDAAVRLYKDLRVRTSSSTWPGWWP